MSSPKAHKAAAPALRSYSAKTAFERRHRCHRSRPRLLALSVAIAALTAGGCRIEVEVEGEGSVSSDSGSIDCSHEGGPDCAETYTSGTTELLRATPAPGFVFSAWENCDYLDLLSCIVSFNDAAAATSATVPIRARFEEVRPSVEPATYTYNAWGQRVTKTVAGKTTVFVYDNQGLLIAEIDGQTGQTLREHIHVDAVPVAQITTDPVTGRETTQFVHTDHLGTPTLLTDENGQVVADIEATPFGEPFVAYSAVAHNRRFPGQYRDRETGLHYNYFRDYDPTLGRYTQSDPIGLGGGLNTYAYAASRPTSLIDPRGLEFLNAAACVGALGSIVSISDILRLMDESQDPEVQSINEQLANVDAQLGDPNLSDEERLECMAERKLLESQLIDRVSEIGNSHAFDLAASVLAAGAFGAGCVILFPVPGV